MPLPVILTAAAAEKEQKDKDSPSPRTETFTTCSSNFCISYGICLFVKTSLVLVDGTRSVNELFQHIFEVLPEVATGHLGNLLTEHSDSKN